MKQNPILTQATNVAEFSGFESIEPTDLISFSQEYLDHVPVLREYLKNQKDKQIDILIARITESGSFERKILRGLVSRVEENQFVLFTNKDFSGVESEEGFDLVIRFENVLGNVPLMLDAGNIKPFVIDSSEKFKEYFDFLEQAKTVMQSAVGVVHAATLYYRYDKKHQTFRNGNYCVECEIAEVNKSNVLIHEKRTFAYVDKNDRYVNIVPRTHTDRFIAPDRFLRRVEIHFGVRHNINPADDEDFSE